MWRSQNGDNTTRGSQRLGARAVVRRQNEGDRPTYINIMYINAISPAEYPTRQRSPNPSCKRPQGCQKPHGVLQETPGFFAGRKISAYCARMRFSKVENFSEVESWPLFRGFGDTAGSFPLWAATAAKNFGRDLGPHLQYRTRSRCKKLQ